jgi:hypothetical protein
MRRSRYHINIFRRHVGCSPAVLLLIWLPAVLFSCNEGKRQNREEKIPLSTQQKDSTSTDSVRKAPRGTIHAAFKAERRVQDSSATRTKDSSVVKARLLSSAAARKDKASIGNNKSSSEKDMASLRHGKAKDKASTKKASKNAGRVLPSLLPETCTLSVTTDAWTLQVSQGQEKTERK